MTASLSGEIVQELMCLDLAETTILQSHVHWEKVSDIWIQQNFKSEKSISGLSLVTINEVFLKCYVKQT